MIHLVLALIACIAFAGVVIVAIVACVEDAESARADDEQSQWYDTIDAYYPTTRN